MILYDNVIHYDHSMYDWYNSKMTTNKIIAKANEVWIVFDNDDNNLVMILHKYTLILDNFKLLNFKIKEVLKIFQYNCL